MFAKFSTFAQFIQPLKITKHYGTKTNWFATFWPTNHNTCSTHLFTNEVWKNCISVCTHPRSASTEYYHRKLHTQQLLWILQTPTTYHERQQLITLQSTHQTPISNLQTNPAHRRNNQRLQISTIAKNNKIEGQYLTANGANVFIKQKTLYHKQCFLFISNNFIK